MRTKRLEHMGQSLTLADIKNWPATVDVVTAGRSLGLGRNGCYEAAKAGTFPVRVLKIGTRYRVVTSELVALLEAGTSAKTAS